MKKSLRFLVPQKVLTGQMEEQKSTGKQFLVANFQLAKQ